MDTKKVNRVEVINHTIPLEDGGGRAYTYWDRTNEVRVEVMLQDDGRTLKIFIR
jgi:hypothetical protein